MKAMNEILMGISLVIMVLFWESTTAVTTAGAFALLFGVTSAMLRLLDKWDEKEHKRGNNE